MKFKVKNEFRSGRRTFEVENNHDTSRMADVSEDDVRRWYRAGFVDIEGEEPGPDLNPNRVELVVTGANHNQDVKEPK